MSKKALALWLGGRVGAGSSRWRVWLASKGKHVPLLPALTEKQPGGQVPGDPGVGSHPVPPGASRPEQSPRCNHLLQGLHYSEELREAIITASDLASALQRAPMELSAVSTEPLTETEKVYLWGHREPRRQQGPLLRILQLLVFGSLVRSPLVSRNKHPVP